MTKQARELAELMGWDNFEKVGTGYWCSPPQNTDLKKRPIPAYDTDRNAMHKVHKVLKERGLWEKFISLCFGKPNHIKVSRKELYIFLNDLPGQVQAAIQVMKEAK